MGKLVKIGEAARLLGVSQNTLRLWEKEGRLIPEDHVPGETRYYDVQKLLKLKDEDIETDLTYAYSRVSSFE